jgi:hypothetical protein
LLFSLSAATPAQTTPPRFSADDNSALQRNLLLTKLRARESEDLKLNNPLASALAQAAQKQRVR